LDLDQLWCKKDSRISNWSKEYKVRGAVLRVYFNCILSGLNGMHVNLEFCQIYNNLFVFLEFSRNCVAVLKTHQETHVVEPSF